MTIRDLTRSARTLASISVVAALAACSGAAPDPGAVSPASRAATVFTATEFPVTTSPSFDYLPLVGRDAQGSYVAYTSRAAVGTGYGPGTLYYQRLDESGAPTGSPVLVSTGGSDDQLNDAFGNHIVYSAYDAQTAMSGKVVLYDIDAASSTVLGSADALREARIHGDYVAGVQGVTSVASVMLYDLRNLGTDAAPTRIAGPSPAANNPEIGDRFLVWDQPGGTSRDLYAYDLSSGVKFVVANDPANDEWLGTTNGPWIVWETRFPGLINTRIEAVNVDTDERRVIVDNGFASYTPSIDGNVIGYESRASGDFDVYAYRLDTRDTFRITTHPADQRLNNLFGDVIAYVDARSGSMDVYAAKLTWPEADPVAAGLEAIGQALEAIQRSQLENPQRVKAFANKVAAVAAMVDEGRLDEAAQKLEHDLLAKTDGCRSAWRPDPNDWIVCCGAQLPLEDAIRATLAAMGR